MRTEEQTEVPGPPRRLVRAVLERLRRNRRGLIELFLGVLVPLCLFAILADLVVHQHGLWWDSWILTWIHSHASPEIDTAMVWASRVGTWHGVVPFSILFPGWLLLRRRASDALFFAVSMSGAGLLNVVTKQLFGRERPSLWPSPAPEESFSFPSGHAMGSMALAAALGVLAWRTPARWPIVLAGALFVLLISGSRLYLGVHYPSDVLAAWLASLAWVLGLRQLLLAKG
jgi:undecaprenyl-diphosphatase